MISKLKVLDLFSGIGGFSLGLERTGGFETVAFCEIEEFPRRVLRKHWPEVPIHRDVRELRGADVGTVDVVCGGYPCQPFSNAGKRLGEEDDRHLWPEYRRLVEELRPAWVIGENVAGHITMGLDNVLSDLAALGYACRTFVIPACAVNAPHRRDRVWIVAHAELGKSGERSDVDQKRRRSVEAEQTGMGRGNASDAECVGPSGSRRSIDASRCKAPTERETDWSFHVRGWPTEPPVRGANDGLSRELVESRLKALGNAVVPQIPEMIGRAILAARAAA